MSDEQDVLAATLRFYDAIDHMIEGKGVEPMVEAWHHTDRVTSGHPTGSWAHGWEEIRATWEAFASIGRPGQGGGKVRDVSVHLYGDVAYTTSVYVAAASFGGATMNCTNVLHKVDGVWKIVHHHADRTPSIDATIDRLASET